MAVRLGLNLPQPVEPEAPSKFPFYLLIANACVFAILLVLTILRRLEIIGAAD